MPDGKVTAPVEEAITTRTSEAHGALMSDHGRLVDTVLTLKDLILSFDERLTEQQQEIARLKDRLKGVELLQLRDGMQAGRTA